MIIIHITFINENELKILIVFFLLNDASIIIAEQQKDGISLIKHINMYII